VKLLPIEQFALHEGGYGRGGKKIQLTRRQY